MKPLRDRLLVLVACWLTAATAAAQGRIFIERPPDMPMPGVGREAPLVIKYQRVYAEIVDGVATATVTQTFTNPLNRQVEGTYIYPLPDQAAVGDFVMTVGGNTMHGEVLDADQARQTYERIVRQARDPGLLEFIGQRLYKARVFPIPPRGDVEVKLSYSATLQESGGLGQFIHPLRAELPAGQSIGELLVHAKLKSTLPLTSVFCPSHKCEIKQTSDHEATVTYEESNARPQRDFQLYYQRKDAQFGLVTLTHRAAGEPGYFMLRLSPRIETAADEVLPKDIIFVIDTSGSMKGGKIEQVKASLKFCINSLNPGDRFNLVTFSTEIHHFRDKLVGADADIRAAALDFVGDINAVGGTNINDALLAALGDDPHDAKRPFLIVFMTDGLPTVGITDIGAILKSVAGQNSQGVRVHVLGVGSDVNTRLLDTLAEQSRGTRDYCLEQEDLELKLSAFVGRLTDPLLSDLKLHFGDLGVSDVYPKQLSDLFRGTDVVVLGRYTGDGQSAVELAGRATGGDKTLIYEGDFPKLDKANEFLPRLWATRKVGYLLDEMRLHGQNQELVDEVKRLAKKHGIVTPYTSALIVEDTPLAIAGARMRHNSVVITGSRADLDGVLDSIDLLESRGHVAGGASAGPAPTRRGGRGRGDTPADAKMAEGAAREPSVDFYYSFAPESETPAPAESGRGAVESSLLLQRLKKDGVLDAREFGLRAPDGKSIIRHVGAKTFLYDGRRWLDTAWDGEKETTQVEAFSDGYFALLTEHDDIARYLALGERLVLVIGEKIYEISPPEDD